MAQELTDAVYIEILEKKVQSLADLVLMRDSEIERLRQELRDRDDES